MRIAIVQFPGSNCERETIMAVKRAAMEPVEFLWNEPLAKLQQCDGYILVGGFSFEDRSRAGIIAALDPVMLCIKEESAKGKPVLGICNGAQILVECGLVPGIENNKMAMALTANKRMRQGEIIGTGFYNQWVYLRLSDQYQRNAFTRYLTPKDVLHLPVAHAEGRFVMSAALFAEITNLGLNVFQYCDATGAISEDFPVNPNGSIGNIAAIANKAGNVLAIMPHPERTPACDAIFNSMRDYISSKRFLPVHALNYYPRPTTLSLYAPEQNSKTWVVGAMITDNTALSVQNCLQQIGLESNIQRYLHWEITCSTADAVAAIAASELLFNPNKEYLVADTSLPGNSVYFLTRLRANIDGQEKLQILRHHFDIKGIISIKAGILWQFCTKKATIGDISTTITKTNIIHNPYAHDCYQFKPQ